MGHEQVSRPWYDDRVTTLWDPNYPFGPSKCKASKNKFVLAQNLEGRP